MRSDQTEPDEAYADEALTISPEQVCFLIVKAREFDVKDGDSELESGSNASDDRMVSVLEDRRGRSGPAGACLLHREHDGRRADRSGGARLARPGRQHPCGLAVHARGGRERASLPARTARRAISSACRYCPTISKRGSPCSENPASNSRSEGFEQGRESQGAPAARCGIAGRARRERAADRSLSAQYDAGLSRSRHDRNVRVRVLHAQASAEPRISAGGRAGASARLS